MIYTIYCRLKMHFYLKYISNVPFLHLLFVLVFYQGTKGFKCDVCAREFTLSANLKRHMLIHASVRPFQCHVCFKSFVQKQTLKTHMIVHLPVKPFKCKVTSNTQNQVWRCTSNHTSLWHIHHQCGKSLLICFQQVCGKSFNRMYNLLGHMHLHAGSKPFKCAYCSSKFNLKGNLSRHMKVKHGMDVSPDGQGEKNITASNWHPLIWQ